MGILRAIVGSPSGDIMDRAEIVSAFALSLTIPLASTGSIGLVNFHAPILASHARLVWTALAFAEIKSRFGVG